MNPTRLPEDALANASRSEIMSALFANLITQQTNMALMLLGRVPHPETGEQVHDLEAAKLFIDQLEMIEFKTNGNLTAEETALLKRSLESLHAAFVAGLEGQMGDDAPAAR